MYTDRKRLGKVETDILQPRDRARDVDTDLESEGHDRPRKGHPLGRPRAAPSGDAPRAPPPRPRRAWAVTSESARIL